jgi:F-type H+-transporting ATPase subunit a
MSVFSPLEQFAISTLIPLEFLGWNISITNATLFLVLTSALAYGTLRLCMLDATVVPSNWQYVAEELYNFVNEKLVKELIGEKGSIYFPFFFCIIHFYLYQ